jgi:transcriptional regulator with XRE-family HTH domain
MAKSDAFSRLFDAARAKDSYWDGLVKLRFANDLGDLMVAQDVSQAELARRLDRSPQYVSRILKGDENFTIGTMTKLLRTFGLVPRIEGVSPAAFYAQSEVASTLGAVCYSVSSLQLSFAEHREVRYTAGVMDALGAPGDIDLGSFDFLDLIGGKPVAVEEATAVEKSTAEDREAVAA